VAKVRRSTSRASSTVAPARDRASGVGGSMATDALWNTYAGAAKAGVVSHPEGLTPPPRHPPTRDASALAGAVRPR
jgi:hypothetical protein